MSFEIVEGPDLLHITLSGILIREDLAGMRAAADEIERRRNPVPHRITEMTGVTVIKVGYPEVREFAVYRRNLKFPNSFKSAIVVGSQVQLGIARMFQTLNHNPWITVQIFDDHAAARSWIGDTASVEGS